MNRLSSRHFLLGRLHSLAGVVPLGLFLLEHLYSNAVALLGKDAYDQHVLRLYAIPFLPVFEVLLILLPLFYHAGYGLYLSLMSRHNPYRYAYARNWLFVLQRASGLVTLVFVVYHLWAFRLANLLFGTPIHFENVREHLQDPWIFAFYVVGVVSTTFHFSNGLSTAMVTWGVTVGARAQRLASVLCGAVFLLLSSVGIGTLFAFV